MTHVISVSNGHEALPEVLNYFYEFGESVNSRNGPTWVAPYPVTLAYRRPWERVVFWEQRDANPYFHFMESMWMLAGRNDVELPATYAKQISQYSDDGKTIPGAYGHRWLQHFDVDQLDWAIKRLRKDPTDRRVVITMWDPNTDIIAADLRGKDVPCNTHIYLNVRHGQLNMQVNCRSNDALWGATGANYVHFSFLQEFLAQSIGAGVGYYFQNAFNFHAYQEFFSKVMGRPKSANSDHDLRHNMSQVPSTRWNPYTDLATGGFKPFALFAHSNYADWQRQLGIFLDGASCEAEGLTDSFFLSLAVQIRESHHAYRDGNYGIAYSILEGLPANNDWKLACQQWLDRRSAERNARNSGTPGDAA